MQNITKPDLNDPKNKHLINIPTMYKNDLEQLRRQRGLEGQEENKHFNHIYLELERELVQKDEEILDVT